MASNLSLIRKPWCGAAALVVCILLSCAALSFAAEVGANDMRISDAGADGIVSRGAHQPAVAYNDRNNLYLAVWQADEDVDNEFEIYGQLIDGATGAEVGTNDFRISDMGPDGNTNFNAYTPSVAYNYHANEFLVIWIGDDEVNGKYEVYGQRLSGSTGTEVGTNDFRISVSGPAGDPAYFAASCDIVYNWVDDEYLVVWSADGNSAGMVDDEFEIIAVRLAGATAAHIGSAVRISDMGPDTNTAYMALEPAVAFNPQSNEYLVVWQGDDGTASMVDDEYEIFGQRLSGATLGAVGINDFRISDMGTDSVPASNGFNPDVAYNNIANEYLVVWQGDDSTSGMVDEEFEIFGQRLTAAGAAAGTNDFRISDAGGSGTSSYPAMQPAVAYDVFTNRYLVVWNGSDDVSGGPSNEYEVFGQLLDAGTGAEVGTNDLRLSDMGPDGHGMYDAEAPAITFNGTYGAFLLAWSGDDDTPPLIEGELEIFVQRFMVDTTDTDGDGFADPVDTDDDNDGLSDGDEAARGTDPRWSDSDADWVGDGEEVADGTHPLDRGSYLSPLGMTVCAEWNGFLGMWNVAEHVNLSASPIGVASTIYSMSGAAQSTRSFELGSGAQYDLLVHDMSGFTPNQYGKVCSAVSGGTPGMLDGRMVYYKPSAASSPGAPDFEFAFAMPYLNGIRWNQYVPFNTFQPSLDPADAANLVANWIQITNLNPGAQNGTLVFFAQDGSVLGSERVSLAAGARQDVSGHRYGTNRYGYAEWQPDDIDQLFQLRNVRYFYNNPGTSDHFMAAFQLEGMVGSGELLAVPLDTRDGSSILEISNVTAADQPLTVNIYSAAGALVQSRSEVIAAHATLHIIMDSILDRAQGVATIDGGAPSSFIAQVMQYSRTVSAGVNYLYGIQAKQALGGTMKGSYNTFLSQGCRLLLINPAGSPAAAEISMRRHDGTIVLAPTSTNVPGHGLVDYDLCANDHADVYGVVTVQAAARNTLVAHVVRTGLNNSYRIPTPVRE